MFSPGVCPMEPSNLVFTFGCLVSNGRRALLGGIRLGGSATPCKEQGPDTDTIHEQQGPPEEVHAQEGAHKEPEIQKKHPITIRPIYVLMKDVTSTCKWYSHDQFKPEN